MELATLIKRLDADPPTAVKTRVDMLDQLEREGTPVVSCHFPLPGFGKVVRYEGRRYWQVGI